MKHLIVPIIVPLLLYVCIFVSGLIISISLGLAKGKFDGKCPLYMTFTMGSSKFTVEFGGEGTCDYVIYLPAVACVVYPFVMIIIYFYIFYRAFTGDDSAIKFIKIYIVTALNTVIFLLLLVSACMVSTGRSITCNGYMAMGADSCYLLDKQTWDDKRVSTNGLISSIVLGEVTTWICLIWWVLTIFPNILYFWRTWKGRTNQTN